MFRVSSPPARSTITARSCFGTSTTRQRQSSCRWPMNATGSSLSKSQTQLKPPLVYETRSGLSDPGRLLTLADGEVATEKGQGAMVDWREYLGWDEEVEQLET